MSTIRKCSVCNIFIPKSWEHEQCAEHMGMEPGTPHSRSQGKKKAYVLMNRESTVPVAVAFTKKAAADKLKVPYSTVCRAFETSGQYLSKEHAIYLIDKL